MALPGASGNDCIYIVASHISLKKAECSILQQWNNRALHKKQNQLSYAGLGSFVSSLWSSVE